MLKFVKKFYKYVIYGALALSVMGVGYFDTYPTYISKIGVLTERECYQVAMLVAASVLNAKGEPIPAGAQKELKDVTRLAKRVANYILEKNPQLMEHDPRFLYQQLVGSCLMSEGEYNLK